MTTYLLTKDAASCYGCGACMQICPKEAIKLLPDAEGFLVPVLDKERCIGCGACVNACPFDTPSCSKSPENVYAAVYKDEEKLMDSSSGGLFSAFADQVLSSGGLVAGCVFDDQLRAVHLLSDNPCDIAEMRGSKYVQSDTKLVYSRIREALSSKRPVLFSGTPCQVDGLKRYLGRDDPLLFTVDLVCHGVPSPMLLEKYLEERQGKLGKITDLRFRDKKRYGWNAQGTITSKSGIKSTSVFNDSYYQLFLRNAVSRMTCYSCKYACTNRVADLTIGDFWGAEDVLTDFDCSKGVSLLLVNTQKGAQLLCDVRDKLNLKETALADAVRKNGNLQKPCEKPREREQIYGQIASEGYAQTAKKICRYKYLMPFIRRLLPKRIKKLLKKVLS